MEQCQSRAILTLRELDLDENHCHVLGAYSRPDLEIELKECRIAGVAAEALAEVLGRNQGPTKLYCCSIDSFVLANGLRGNSRLKSLRPCLSTNPDVGNQELLAIADALKENKGLVDLALWRNFKMSVENAICDSLKAHPTLQDVNLRSIETFKEVPMDPAVLKSRIQTLVDMMKVNMSIHTICLRDCYLEHELFRGSVIPYLETNRLRQRVRALQRACSIEVRPLLLYEPM